MNHPADGSNLSQSGRVHMSGDVISSRSLSQDARAKTTKEDATLR
jgi:hypothetical protein